MFLKLNIYQEDWLRNSGWNPDKENIFLIHGYAGGDDTLPIVVLKDGKFIILNLAQLLLIFLIKNLNYLSLNKKHTLTMANIMYFYLIGVNCVSHRVMLPLYIISNQWLSVWLNILNFYVNLVCK